MFIFFETKQIITLSLESFELIEDVKNVGVYVGSEEQCFQCRQVMEYLAVIL